MEEDIVIYYLWDCYKDIYDIFMIVRCYLNEYYGVDSGILISLIKDKNLDLSKSLGDMAHILSGYVGIISTRNDDGTTRPDN